MKTSKNYSFSGLVTLLILILFVSCKPIIEKEDIDAPEKIISIQEAKDLYDTYTERRLPIIKEFEENNHYDSTFVFEPTRYGWYDYATIKQYLAYIEQEAEEAGVEISGLQFYMANYPEEKTFADQKKVPFPRRNTFFIVPTMKYKKENMAFCIGWEDNGKKKPVLLREIIPRLKANGAVNTTGGQAIFAYKNRDSGDDGTSDSTNNENSLILNESNLVPPPHKTDMD